MNVQAILEVGKIAFQRRPGNTEIFFQRLARYGPARGKKVVDLVDALGDAHVNP
jgi:hypothetical protein